ncbi:hypothetical protein CRUP_034017 [Coryphaenoides rupestris]|nr:hypothetical protein CRUP_034017 [Coryphaenoides rupestris]
MSSHVKLRKDRVGVVIYDTQVKEVRSQLVEQLKVLDLQLEHKTQQLQDLSDYLRRRGEIEGDYARSLERLTEKFTSKIKRKEPSGQSVAQVWLTLLSQTRQESRDHSGLSESCSSLLLQPLASCLDYTQRLSRKSKEVCAQLQDGLLKVTTELQTAWRTYYQYYSDFVCADGKLKDAERQEEKQKTKKMERLIEKRQGKVQEIQVKCSKARNDYLLNLAAANASMNKYYLQDISSVIDRTLSSGLQLIQGTVSSLDQSQDRDHLLQTHHNTFCLPLRFQYQPHDGDQVCEVSTEHELSCELETRFKQIQNRLMTLSQETEEAGKGLLAGHSLLVEGVCDDDLEPSGGGASGGSGGTSSTQEDATENQTSKPSAARRRANLQETEILYLTLKPPMASSAGEDPLADRLCDLDSVAGVLKLYFRSLEDPLFPVDGITQLLESIQMENEAEGVAHLKTVISSYPAPLVVVMRYLFAFLHHLSQYSDENMMQPYNLAVCFGPSLVRGASDDDVVTLQPQINALVKSLILQHEAVFPGQAEVPGPVYEKCMALEQDDCEPIIEDGDADCIQDSEPGALADASSAVPTQRKGERSRSISRSSSEKRVSRHGPPGGTVTTGAKFLNLKLPIGPQVKTLSPGYFRGCQNNSSSEEFTFCVDKEVCRQMDTVFKELSNRQVLQDPSSISTASSPSAQRQSKKKKA